MPKSPRVLQSTHSRRRLRRARSTSTPEGVWAGGGGGLRQLPFSTKERRVWDNQEGGCK